MSFEYVRSRKYIHDIFDTTIGRLMNLYKEAVSIAKSKGKWEKHPNKKRKTQEIAFVSGLGSMWRSDKADKDLFFFYIIVTYSYENCMNRGRILLTTLR